MGTLTSTVENASRFFIVDRHCFFEAVEYYKKTFEAIVVGSFYSPDTNSNLWAELLVYNTRIVLATSNNTLGIQTGNTIEVETIDANSSLMGATDENATKMPISEPEALRGVKEKVLDPYGFTWLFTEKSEDVKTMAESIFQYPPIPSPFLECQRMVRPLLFPALESEVGWWIASQNCERDEWKNTTLNAEQQRRLTICEASVEYYKKQSLEIKNKKFLYRKHFLKDFCSHQCLSEVLSELDRINAMLQGVHVIFLINRLVGVGDIFKKFTDLVNSYHTLLRNLPRISSGDPNMLWPTLVDERKDAACDVRQLLKELLHVRSNIHKDKKDAYHKSVLNEELVMDTMIGEEIQTWRKQDPS